MKPDLDSKKTEIAQRLKTWRKYLNKTQDTFSELSGIKKGVLKKYEAAYNIPGGDALSLIANTGVNINWLLNGEGEMTSIKTSADNDLPEDLQEFEERFVEVFNMLLTLEEPQRGEAVREMVARVKETSRINELERKLKNLEKEN